MRRVGFAVPERVLTGHARTRLTRATEVAGGLWLSAEEALEAQTFETGIWPTRIPAGKAATPVLDGARSARFERGPGGRALLRLVPGTNGGFTDGKTVGTPTLWTAAVVWTGGEVPAKTLFSLRGEDRSDNYVFLSEEEPGLLVLRDNTEALRLEVRLPAALAAKPWQVAMVSVSGEVLTLKLPGVAAYRAGGLAGMPDAARLLVGCRVSRAGMPKSLGAGGISDLLFWPGLDLLAARQEGTKPQDAAQQMPSLSGPPADGTGAPDEASESVSLAQSIRAAFDAFCLWEL